MPGSHLDLKPVQECRCVYYSLVLVARGLIIMILNSFLRKVQATPFFAWNSSFSDIYMFLFLTKISFTKIMDMDL